MTPSQYLQIARKTANARGYDGRALELADDGIHKLKIYDDKGREVKFGRVGYNDFILWSSINPKVADQKRKGYLARATKIKGDWKKNKFSPNNLAIKILW